VLADPFRLVEVDRSTGDAINNQGPPGPRAKISIVRGRSLAINPNTRRRKVRSR
jgi:hypothetical protein